LKKGTEKKKDEKRGEDKKLFGARFSTTKQQELRPKVEPKKNGPRNI